MTAPSPGLTVATREDIDRIADEMERDGLPRSVRVLRRIARPDQLREWDMAGARPCFGWGEARRRR